jgi:hypothetical protein
MVTASEDPRARIQDSAVVEGLKTNGLVDLEKAYSNPRDQAKHLQTLLELPSASRSSRSAADVGVVPEGARVAESGAL